MTVDPSTSAVNGTVGVGGSRIERGGAGYDVHAAVNVPLSDTVALRASGFKRHDPGYVTDITTGRREVDQAAVAGGRAAMLWRPSDVLTLKLNVFLQDTNGDGDANVDTDSTGKRLYGGFTHARLPGTGGYTTKLRLGTALVQVNLGPVDLTSISAYGRYEWGNVSDWSAITASAKALYGVTGAAQTSDFQTRKFTQEIRLSSRTEQRIEWLAGVFYNNERSPGILTGVANDAATGAQVGDLSRIAGGSTLKEYAVFGDLTVHFADRFDVQLGARDVKIHQSVSEIVSGRQLVYQGLPSPSISPEITVDESAVTYLLTPRFKISPDWMAYARFASGYRIGGPNSETSLFGTPKTFQPDKTYNYEVGLKGTLLDGAIQFDSSIYYIDWKNIQVQLFTADAQGIYTSNASGAKSQGVELSVQARPTRGLTLGATAALSEAKLTQAFPPALVGSIGAAGESLPYSSKFAGSLSADQDIPLPNGLTGFVGGTLTYAGARLGEFRFGSVGDNGRRFRAPAWGQLDLHAGTRYDTWSVNLFVNNVMNRAGMLGGGQSNSTGGFIATFMQPRTVGLSATKDF